MNCANLSIETNDRHAEILVEKLKNDLAEALRLSDGASIKLNAKTGLVHAPLYGDNYQSLFITPSKDLLNLEIKLHLSSLQKSHCMKYLFSALLLSFLPFLSNAQQPPTVGTYINENTVNKYSDFLDASVVDLIRKKT
jgi:hypothetical protein